MNRVTNDLIHKGQLKTDLIIDAFAEIPRAEFVSSRMRSAAEADIPIPIGHGYMMPSASVVAFMLELLTPARGERVFVVGHGGGWVSALLSYIVGRQGHVTSVDRSDVLRDQALKNMAKFRFIDRDHIVDTYVAEDCDALQDISLPALFDRILVLDELFLPCHLEDILRPGGTLVAPVNNVITLFQKNTTDHTVQTEAFQGVHFLPL